MSGSQTADVAALMQSAQQDDLLGASTANMLGGIVDLSAKINDAMGIPADQFQASEVLLLAILVDDSGSIAWANNEDAVRDGHNLILDALNASKSQDNVLAHTRLLNGKVITPFVSITNAPKLDRSNYAGTGGTPLYRETLTLLATVLAKSEEFRSQGVPCRTITLIITDGADEHSRPIQAADVKRLVDDLLRQENHIVAAMGIDDGGHTDFNLVFQGMGIKPAWISNPKGSTNEELQHAIRKQCQVFSQSAVRASQSAGSFSQQALGGFGN